MAKLFANSGDPDQMPHSGASDLGLHCWPITLLRVSRLQWVNGELRRCQYVWVEKKKHHIYIYLRDSFICIIDTIPD